MMRRAMLLGGIALAALGGCGKRSAADRVERYYNRKADRVDQQAAQFTNPAVRQIYHDRADALRREGQAREQGLRQAGANHVPRLSSIEQALDRQPNTTANGTAENSAQR